MGTKQNTVIVTSAFLARGKFVGSNKSEKVSSVANEQLRYTMQKHWLNKIYFPGDLLDENAQFSL